VGIKNIKFNTAIWNFFATSHGKNACDGVGGTTKRVAALASLQCTIDRQILTPYQLFIFCLEALPTIKYFYISKDDVNEKTKFLEEHFASACTVAGTRDNHCFIPLSENEIKIS
jgi:hypothetical protein